MIENKILFFFGYELATENKKKFIFDDSNYVIV